ncbi:MAG: site-specific integrase [Flavobacteriales bacterium]|nr:site-specific integrase [Flavobacteriales bacterium]
MKKFEKYLIDNGMYYKVASKYCAMVAKYLVWVDQQGLQPDKVIRSEYTNFEEYCRTELGNMDSTVLAKRTAIKRYNYFMQYSTNSAYNHYKKAKEHTVPTNILEPETLSDIYNNLQDRTIVLKRDRCIFGMVIFQGLTRSELERLTLSDIDLNNSQLYVAAQRTTNARKLEINSRQIMHLHSYINEIRAELIKLKPKHRDTDRLFVSLGISNNLNGTLYRMIREAKKQFPQFISLLQIRQSVITQWEKESGVLEAMVKAGHRNVSSTERYELSKYGELRDELQKVHPLEASGN